MNPTRKLMDMAEEYKKAISEPNLSKAVLIALDLAYETKKLKER